MFVVQYLEHLQIYLSLFCICTAMCKSRHLENVADYKCICMSNLSGAISPLVCNKRLVELAAMQPTYFQLMQYDAFSRWYMLNLVEITVFFLIP